MSLGSLPNRESLEAAGEIVYKAMSPTPQYQWSSLSQRLGTTLWVKHENHTPTGAFKVRGGLVYFAELWKSVPNLPGVISATRGNHGQSVGYAARHYGIPVTIVVPYGNSIEKNSAMRGFGVELIEHGNDFQEAREHAAQLAAERNLHLIPSFHKNLVRGVATYSLELLRSVPDLDVVYVPIGQGSGISGMIAAREVLGLKTEIVGVTSAHAPAFALSFEQRKVVSALATTFLADGMACRLPGEDALEIILYGVSHIVSVTDTEVAQAMQVLFAETHNAAEGAGAAAFAAAWQERHRLQGKKVAVILCGGNVDSDVFASVLQGAVPTVQEPTV